MRRALFIFFFLLPALVFAAEGGVDYEEYSQKKKKYESAQDTVKNWENRVRRAGEAYDRLKAQRQLEMARKAMRDAKKAFEAVRKKIKPGDRAFTEETRFKGDPTSVDNPGPSGPIDPLGALYGRSTPILGGSTGEVVYNKPRSPGAAAGGRMDRRRWKPRDPPAASGRNEASGDPVQSKPDNRQYLLSPDKLGGGRLATQVRGKPVQDIDFVGTREAFVFKPFDLQEPGDPSARETEDEWALIDSAQAHMTEKRYLFALNDTERLLLLRPKDPRVHQLKAMILNSLKRYKEAESAAWAALRLGLEHPSLYETLSWAQFNRGDYAGAYTSAKEALRLSPESPHIRSLLAMIEDSRSRSRSGPADAPAAAAAHAYFPPAARTASLQKTSAGGTLRTASAPGRASSSQEDHAGLPVWMLALGALASLGFAGGGVWLLKRKN